MSGRGAAGSRDATIRVFSLLWGIAAIFHLLYAYEAVGFFHAPTLASGVDALIGLAALLLLARPGDLRAMTALAILTPVSAWLEAPIIGNHWVLGAFVDLAFLLTLAGAAVSRRPVRDSVYAAFLPAARWCLLGFYAFAAFSKLNSAFVDPSVSCGNYFLADSVSSYGLDPGFIQSGWFAHLLPWLVIATELSVPTLLAIRRTRRYGVYIGFAFHSLIALDLNHLFFDFSSLLFPLFLLFLSPSFFERLDARMTSLRNRAPALATPAVLALPLAALVLLWTSPPQTGQPLVGLRIALWFSFDLLLLLALVRYSKDATAGRGQLTGLRRAPWVAVIPALVVFNGLTPYLEIKTGYGWNMYSNLVTIDGMTNHFLIHATAHLTHYQDRPITVISSDDGNVGLYASDGFQITELQLRAYLANHPETAITFIQGGHLRRLEHASQDPALVQPVSPIAQRLLSFRAIDPTSPNRCQPNFQPLT